MKILHANLDHVATDDSLVGITIVESPLKCKSPTHPPLLQLPQFQNHPCVVIKYPKQTFFVLKQN